MGKTGKFSLLSRTALGRGRGIAWGWWVLTFALVMSFALAQAQDSIVLVGSGSTVPAPLYNRWAPEYGKRSTKIQMKYLPIGTSEGIKQISHGTGDFGAGEVPLTAKQRSDGGLVDLPVVIIGIVPIYNLPGVHQTLRLSGDVLAEIFLGEVKTWNAPQIAKLNPDITLPNLPIQVVNRPGGKGTNYVFSEFLSKASSKFRDQIGVSPSPSWPVGIPAERSSDMADRVKSTPGAIGYAELEYAMKGNISQAAVENPAGKFVQASAESITEACRAVESPQWNNFSASLIDASAPHSYPITSFTWIYVKTQSTDSARAAALTDFLDWMYSDGQQFAGQEGYSALPQPLLAAVRKKVKTLR
ncbi:MAG TPA: phosphate ABC transporter substrate-binding protein PstS [Terriglobales bacterium]|nr:phosphate ABC transporter substrate-binding protein PstS [Terriglobales bacterium]